MEHIQNQKRNVTSRKLVLRSVGIAAALALIYLATSTATLANAQEDLSRYMPTQSDLQTIRPGWTRFDILSDEGSDPYPFLIEAYGFGAKGTYLWDEPWGYPDFIWVRILIASHPSPDTVPKRDDLEEALTGEALQTIVSKGALAIGDTSFYVVSYSPDNTDKQVSLMFAKAKYHVFVRVAGAAENGLWEGQTSASVPSLQDNETLARIIEAKLPAGAATAAVTTGQTVASTYVRPTMTGRVSVPDVVSDAGVPVAVAVTATVSSLAIAVSQGFSAGGWVGNVRETINTVVNTVKGARYGGLTYTTVGRKEIEPGTPGYVTEPPPQRSWVSRIFGPRSAEAAEHIPASQASIPEWTQQRDALSPQQIGTQVGAQRPPDVATLPGYRPTFGLPMSQEDERDLKLILDLIAKSRDGRASGLIPAELDAKIVPLEHKLNTTANTWEKVWLEDQRKLAAAEAMRDQLKSELRTNNTELNDWRTLPERKAWLEARNKELEISISHMNDEIDGPIPPRGYYLGNDERGLRGQVEISRQLYSEARSDLHTLQQYRGVPDLYKRVGE